MKSSNFSLCGLVNREKFLINNVVYFQPLILCSVRDDQEKVELSVRLVAELAPTDVMYLQIYNIMVRKCLEFMELEELGRHFYDRHQAIKIEAHRLELWPGYKTSMRNHEHDVLLGVEITHKVLRTDNCLHVMTRLRGGQNYRVSGVTFS